MPHRLTPTPVSRASRSPSMTSRTRLLCGPPSRALRPNRTTNGTRPSTTSPRFIPSRATFKAHAPSWRRRAPSIRGLDRLRWLRSGTPFRPSCVSTARPPGSAMLKRIHHVGVVVQNLEEGLKFWRDTLGLEFIKSATVVDQGVKAALLDAGGSEIELLEPINPDGGVGKFLARRGGGLHHVCFESDGVAGDLEAARAKGIQLIDQKPRAGLAGMICFLHPKATRGVLVEYAQPIEE